MMIFRMSTEDFHEPLMKEIIAVISPLQSEHMFKARHNLHIGQMVLTLHIKGMRGIRIGLVRKNDLIWVWKSFKPGHIAIRKAVTIVHDDTDLMRILHGPQELFTASVPPSDGLFWI